MIKIVAKNSLPSGSTVSLINLTNFFNKNGLECAFYAPDYWHIDKCKGEYLSEFKIGFGDTIIVSDFELESIYDFLNLQKIIAPKHKGNNKFKNFRIDLRHFLKPLRIFALPMLKSNNFILSVQDNLPAKNISFYNKIHFVSQKQADNSPRGKKYFVCPNIIEKLNPSTKKPNNIAGIIGSIKPQNNIEKAINKALEDGMKEIILFGNMVDMKYFYNNVEPLIKQYPQVKYAGFLEDRQKIYDRISHVYAILPDKNWSALKEECEMTATTLVGEIPTNDYFSEDEILKIWKKEL